MSHAAVIRVLARYRMTENLRAVLFEIALEERIEAYRRRRNLSGFRYCERTRDRAVAVMRRVRRKWRSPLLLAPPAAA